MKNGEPYVARLSIVFLFPLYGSGGYPHLLLFSSCLPSGISYAPDIPEGLRMASFHRFQRLQPAQTVPASLFRQSTSSLCHMTMHAKQAFQRSLFLFPSIPRLTYFPLLISLPCFHPSLRLRFQWYDPRAKKMQCPDLPFPGLLLC